MGGRQSKDADVDETADAQFVDEVKALEASIRVKLEANRPISPSNIRTATAAAAGGGAKPVAFNIRLFEHDGTEREQTIEEGKPFTGEMLLVLKRPSGKSGNSSTNSTCTASSDSSSSIEIVNPTDKFLLPSNSIILHRLQFFESLLVSINENLVDHIEIQFEEEYKNAEHNINEDNAVTESASESSFESSSSAPTSTLTTSSSSNHSSTAASPIRLHTSKGRIFCINIPMNSYLVLYQPWQLVDSNNVLYVQAKNHFEHDTLPYFLATRIVTESLLRECWSYLLQRPTLAIPTPTHEMKTILLKVHPITPTATDPGQTTYSVIDLVSQVPSSSVAFHLHHDLAFKYSM